MEALDLAPIDADDNITGLDACLVGGTAFHHFTDKATVLGLETEALSQFIIQISAHDPQHTAANLAVFDNLIHQAVNHVGRYCEADTNVTTAGSHNSGIDTDKLAAQVNQGAA